MTLTQGLFRNVFVDKQKVVSTKKEFHLPTHSMQTMQSTNDSAAFGHSRRPPARHYQPRNVGPGSRMLSSVNAVFMHFSRRSTIHGLNHMAQAKSAKRRFFWLMISVIASSGFFVNLYYLIEKFVQKPVLTNVFHDFTGFVYPDITFCITNPIHFPPNGTEANRKLMKILAEYRQFKRSKHKMANRVQLADYLFMRKADVYSHTQWSAIISCHYMQKPCHYSHFELRRVWPYGNCYTFNATKMPYNLSRHVMKSMSYNGFRPDFRLVVYKALSRPPNFTLDPHHSLTMPSGVMVMIHEAGTYPHIGESFIVDGCTQIDLKIIMKSHLQLLNKCDPHRVHYNYVDVVTRKNVTFLGRQSDCIFEKIQYELPKACGCQWHSLPIPSENVDIPFCSNGQFNTSHMRKCFGIAYNRINKINLPACYRDLCNHTSYSTVVSHSKYPAVRERNTQLQWLSKLLDMEKLEKRKYGGSDLSKIGLLQISGQTQMNLSQAVKEQRSDLLNIDFVERNFMMLRIVPASLFMDLVEESEEYPMSRLMSDIGGCVGLWVGASLITVFEFFDLILDFTEVTGYRRRERKSNGDVNSSQTMSRTANNVFNSDSKTFKNDYHDSMIDDSGGLSGILDQADNFESRSNSMVAGNSCAPFTAPYDTDTVTLTYSFNTPNLITTV